MRRGGPLFGPGSTATRRAMAARAGRATPLFGVGSRGGGGGGDRPPR